MAQGRQHVGDLLGELAGGHEDEGARAPLRADGGVLAASRASIGRPNARVLPEPVWARPRTSRPARASGRARDWMANGPMMPRAASAVTRRRVHAQLGEAGLGRLGESGGRGERRVERGARIAARFLAALLRAAARAWRRCVEDDG